MFFNGAQTASVFMACEYAVFSVDDGCHAVSLLVGVGYALLLYDLLRIVGEVWQQLWQVLLYCQFFILCDGCSGIAFYAALSSALLQIAAEKLGEYFCCEEHVVDLQEWHICVLVVGSAIGLRCNERWWVAGGFILR